MTDQGVRYLEPNKERSAKFFMRVVLERPTENREAGKKERQRNK